MRIIFAAMALLIRGTLWAHSPTFNSTITYAESSPTGGAESVFNWTGAAFDAGNIGGSEVNGDGGANNGRANDALTYVSKDRLAQGQTFTTGSHAHGYELASITVRMAGYRENVATGANVGGYHLNPSMGPIIVSIGKLSGSTFAVQIMQPFMAGSVGSPGAGATANGPGTYLTFHLPSSVHLDPQSTYAFDLAIGSGSENHFEWLGTSASPYSGGGAYTRSGGTITPLSGDRVFMVSLTASPNPAVPFAHPGALHTQADLNRMKDKVAAGAQPWTADFNLLAASKYAQTKRTPGAVTTIVRGTSGNNYTRTQEDAVSIYQLALRYQITGNIDFARQAVVIANAWARKLTGITGDSNQSLASGICGFQFACAGDLLRGYPGWPAAEQQAFQDMMMRVFYPANFDFLWRRHDTIWREGGSTHYRLNWDTCNMASMMAIGVLCDNRAVYQQAVDFFKYGPGNGRIERAAWYIFPDGSAQTEEMGRDQGHDIGGWDYMARMCQVAWNQGEDLYGYDNNRVLRGLEYVAKYNLGYEVPYLEHRNSQLPSAEREPSRQGRGNLVPMYEMVFHHYVNERGLAAPYSQLAAEKLRPEPGPNTALHPSQVDWLGFGTLTFSRDPIAAGVAPSGLRANWSRKVVTLSWWGSAYATSYVVKRATNPGGPFTKVGTATALETNYRDQTVSDGTAYYYVVSALTPTGETPNSEALAVQQRLVSHYAFEGNASDDIGNRPATLHGGATGLPTYSPGKVGAQAIRLDGVDDYVQLPVGSGNYQDITLCAWVYWSGGGHHQRIFDFGNEIEQSLWLTPSTGSKMRLMITSTRGFEGSGVLEGPILAVNQWVHVAFTLNGQTGSLFVNGLPVDTQTMEKLDPLFGQVFCYLGKSMWSRDPLFKGLLDDFRIYNFALSGEEIYRIWGGNKSAPSTGTGIP